MTPPHKSPSTRLPVSHKFTPGFFVVLVQMKGLLVPLGNYFDLTLTLPSLSSPINLFLPRAMSPYLSSFPPLLPVTPIGSSLLLL